MDINMHMDIIEKDIKMRTDSLEDVFDIDSGSTMVEYTEKDHIIPKVVPDEYDKKDQELDDQYDTIYAKAIDAFDDQMESVVDIEGRYQSRNIEVANQLLSTALNAAKEKTQLKRHKDIIKLKEKDVGMPDTVNNNLIIDRNELLKILQEKDVT